MLVVFQKKKCFKKKNILTLVNYNIINYEICYINNFITINVLLLNRFMKIYGFTCILMKIYLLY